MIRKLDTSTLGPIKVEDHALATRARVVREALLSLANEPGCGWLFQQIAQSAPDEVLAKLRRMLR